MHPRSIWPEDLKFIEFGVHDVRLAAGLQQAGYSKYLGVSGSKPRIAKLRQSHPQWSERLTCAKYPRIVRENNADVLLLSGAAMLYVWKFRSVRHADSVAWRCSLNPLSWIALLGCLWHLTSKSYAWPRMLTLCDEAGRKSRLFVARVKRKKICHRLQLHFIPHGLGLSGMFKAFTRADVQYVVLRWFDALPSIEPGEDIDLLVADESLPDVLRVLDEMPGIQPCDVYSEHGLTRSDYCGTPYLPGHVARRILDGAELQRGLFMAPNAWDHFHSLAYHAVYHKGLRTNLSRAGTGLSSRGESKHDFTSILGEMAANLGIDVEISLEGLHGYLQESGWGPSPEMLARLSMACSGNKWLRMLSERLEPYVHDQGLTVFVVRREAFERGFHDRVRGLIEQSGFQILASKILTPNEVKIATARTRGGNWGTGPFDKSGGPPAGCIVAYDPNPLAPNRRQRRKFPQRTNARIFVKEKIRDIIVAELPQNEGCNAIHSSDHAAEAWHLIEAMAPELREEIRDQINGIHGAQAVAPPYRRAA